MRQDLHIAAHLALILALLTLTACNGMTVTPSTAGDEMLLATAAQSNLTCADCAEATRVVALTQEQKNADDRAAATAEIVRANAQTTLNSANATLNAVQTQEQDNADVVAAQLAATLEIERANAQATLNSAGSTQIAAQTQSQYDLQVTQAVATQNEFAANTQTAVANGVATQTQIAAATAQWYADQARQREEQRQGPIAFLWMWCLPIFLILFAGLVLWGVWRWLKIQQANQLVLESPEVIHQHDNSLPYIESDVVDSQYQLIERDDQMDQWLDEVKSKLLSGDEKDKDDNTNP